MVDDGEAGLLIPRDGADILAHRAVGADAFLHQRVDDGPSVLGEQRRVRPAGHAVAVHGLGSGVHGHQRAVIAPGLADQGQGGAAGALGPGLACGEGACTGGDPGVGDHGHVAFHGRCGPVAGKRRFLPAVEDGLAVLGELQAVHLLRPSVLGVQRVAADLLGAVLHQLHGDGIRGMEFGAVRPDLPHDHRSIGGVGVDQRGHRAAYSGGGQHIAFRQFLLVLGPFVCDRVAFAVLGGQAGFGGGPAVGFVQRDILGEAIAALQRYLQLGGRLGVAVMHPNLPDGHIHRFGFVGVGHGEADLHVAGHRRLVPLGHVDFAHGVGDLPALFFLGQVCEFCVPAVALLQDGLLYGHIVGQQLHRHGSRAFAALVVAVVPDLLHADLGSLGRMGIGDDGDTVIAGIGGAAYGIHAGHAGLLPGVVDLFPVRHDGQPHDHTDPVVFSFQGERLDRPAVDVLGGLAVGQQLHRDGCGAQLILIVAVIPHLQHRQAEPVGRIGVFDRGLGAIDLILADGVAFHRFFHEGVHDFVAVVLVLGQVFNLAGPAMGFIQCDLFVRQHVVLHQHHGDRVGPLAVAVVVVAPGLHDLNIDLLGCIGVGKDCDCCVSDSNNNRFGCFVADAGKVFLRPGIGDFLALVLLGQVLHRQSPAVGGTQRVFSCGAFAVHRCRQHDLQRFGTFAVLIVVVLPNLLHAGLGGFRRMLVGHLEAVDGSRILRYIVFRNGVYDLLAVCILGQAGKGVTPLAGGGISRDRRTAFFLAIGKQANGHSPGPLAVLIVRIVPNLFNRDVDLHRLVLVGDGLPVGSFGLISAVRVFNPRQLLDQRVDARQVFHHFVLDRTTVLVLRQAAVRNGVFAAVISVHSDAGRIAGNHFVPRLQADKPHIIGGAQPQAVLVFRVSPGLGNLDRNGFGRMLVRDLAAIRNDTVRGVSGVIVQRIHIFMHSIHDQRAGSSAFGALVLGQAGIGDGVGAIAIVGHSFGRMGDFHGGCALSLIQAHKFGIIFRRLAQPIAVAIIVPDFGNADADGFGGVLVGNLPDTVFILEQINLCIVQVQLHVHEFLDGVVDFNAVRILGQFLEGIAPGVAIARDRVAGCQFLLCHRLTIGVEDDGDLIRPHAILIAVVVPDLGHRDIDSIGRIGVGDGKAGFSIASNSHLVLHTVKGNLAFGDGCAILILDLCDSVGDLLTVLGFLGQLRPNVGPVITGLQFVDQVGPFQGHSFAISLCGKLDEHTPRPFAVLIVVIRPELGDLHTGHARRIGVGQGGHGAIDNGLCQGIPLRQLLRLILRPGIGNFMTCVIILGQVGDGIFPKIVIGQRHSDRVAVHVLGRSAVGQQGHGQTDGTMSLSVVVIIPNLDDRGRCGLLAVGVGDGDLGGSARVQQSLCRRRAVFTFPNLVRSTGQRISGHARELDILGHGIGTRGQILPSDTGIGILDLHPVLAGTDRFAVQGIVVVVSALHRHQVDHIVGFVIRQAADSLDYLEGGGPIGVLNGQAVLVVIIGDSGRQLAVHVSRNGDNHGMLNRGTAIIYVIGPAIGRALGLGDGVSVGARLRVGNFAEGQGIPRLDLASPSSRHGDLGNCSPVSVNSRLSGQRELEFFILVIAGSRDVTGNGLGHLRLRLGNSVSVGDGQVVVIVFAIRDRRGPLAGGIIAGHHNRRGLGRSVVAHARNIARCLGNGVGVGVRRSVGNGIEDTRLTVLDGNSVSRIRRHRRAILRRQREREGLVAGQVFDIALDRLGHGQLRRHLFVGDGGYAVAGLISGNVLHIANLHGLAAQHIAGGNSFLPIILQLMAVGVLVHTQRHHGPVVVGAQGGAGGSSAVDRGLEGNRTGKIAVSHRALGNDLFAAVQLHRHASGTGGIVVVIPHLQHRQAVTAGVMSVGDGDHVARIGDGIVARSGIGRGFGHDALDGVATLGHFTILTLILDPGVGLLHAVHVCRQTVHNAGQRFGHIARRGIISGIVARREALVIFIIREFDADAGIHIIGIQLHGHGGGPLAILIAVVVPFLDHLGHGLQGGVGVGSGDSDRTGTFACSVDCHRLIFSKGYAREIIPRLGGLICILFNIVNASGQVRPGDNTICFDLDPTVFLGNHSAIGGVIGLGCSSAVPRARGDLGVDSHVEGLLLQGACAAAIDDLAIQGHGLFHIQIAELVGIDHVDGLHSAYGGTAVVYEILPICVVLILPTNILYFEISTIVEQGCVIRIIFMPANLDLHDLLLAVVGQARHRARSREGFLNLVGVGTFHRDVGYHELAHIILMQGYGSRRNGAGFSCREGSRGILGPSDGYSELRIQLEQRVVRIVDQLPDGDLDLYVAVAQLGKEDQGLAVLHGLLNDVGSANSMLFVIIAGVEAMHRLIQQYVIQIFRRKLNPPVAVTSPGRIHLIHADGVRRPVIGLVQGDNAGFGSCGSIGGQEDVLHVLPDRGIRTGSVRIARRPLQLHIQHQVIVGAHLAVGQPLLGHGDAVLTGGIAVDQLRLGGLAVLHRRLRRGSGDSADECPAVHLTIVVGDKLIDITRTFNILGHGVLANGQVIHGNLAVGFHGMILFVIRWRFFQGSTIAIVNHIIGFGLRAFADYGSNGEVVFLVLQSIIGGIIAAGGFLHFRIVDEYALADLQVALGQGVGDGHFPICISLAVCRVIGHRVARHVVAQFFNHLVGDLVAVVVLGQVGPFDGSAIQQAVTGFFLQSLVFGFSKIGRVIPFGLGIHGHRLGIGVHVGDFIRNLDYFAVFVLFVHLILANQTQLDILAQTVLVVFIVPHLGGFHFGGGLFMLVGQLGDVGDSAAVFGAFFGVNAGHAAGIGHFGRASSSGGGIGAAVFADIVLEGTFVILGVNYSYAISNIIPLVVLAECVSRRAEIEGLFTPLIFNQFAINIILIHTFDHGRPIVGLGQDHEVLLSGRIGGRLLGGHDARHLLPILGLGSIWFAISIIQRIIFFPQFQDHAIRPHAVTIILVVPGLGNGNAVSADIAVDKLDGFYTCSAIDR